MLTLTEAHKYEYDRQPFVTSHELVGNSLLEISSLAAMIQRLPENQVYFSSGSLPKNADFDRASIEHASKFNLADALQNLSGADSYVMVRGPESDPEYRPLFESVLERVSTFSERVDPDVRGAMFYLFLSSPNSITPFHVDRYTTFLMQVMGTKKVYVWDPRDRLTVSEEAREILFADRNQRGPQLPKERESIGVGHNLSPGQALHIPFCAPHWVENGPEVSISLSIIYRTRHTDRMMNAHCLNHRLRHRMGVNPRPVGASPLLDSAKDIAERVIQKLR